MRHRALLFGLLGLYFLVAALMSVVFAPSGKPTTQQVFTPLPRSFSATSRTWVGLTQTLAKLYCLASAQKRRTVLHRMFIQLPAER